MAGILNTHLIQDLHTLIQNKCHSRLDHFMIGKNSSFKLKNTQITKPVQDINVIDHGAVKVTFSLTTHQKGKGY